VQIILSEIWNWREYCYLNIIIRETSCVEIPLIYILKPLLYFLFITPIHQTILDLKPTQATASLELGKNSTLPGDMSETHWIAGNRHLFRSKMFLGSQLSYDKLLKSIKNSRCHCPRTPQKIVSVCALISGSFLTVIAEIFDRLTATNYEAIPWQSQWSSLFLRFYDFFLKPMFALKQNKQKCMQKTKKKEEIYFAYILHL